MDFVSLLFCLSAGIRGCFQLRREAIMLLFIRPNVEGNEEVQICQQDRHALEIEQGDDREHFFALEKAQNNEMLWFASGRMSAIV